MEIYEILAQELSLSEKHVKNVLDLFAEGNTIPFIARYRKEMTGTMDDTTLRNLWERLNYLENLIARKETISATLTEQGVFSAELQKALNDAKTLQEAEDIYRPFKQKRKTRASVARGLGLAPLAKKIMMQTNTPLAQLAAPFVNSDKGINTQADALAGAADILADEISDNPAFRQRIRQIFFKSGVLCVKPKTTETTVYTNYYEFSAHIKKLVPHNILAINRGEKEGVLSVHIEVAEDEIYTFLSRQIIKNANSPAKEVLENSIIDSFRRLIRPSVENEIRTALTEKAETHAIGIFSQNLKNLLLQPPLKESVVLGIDPGYRTGCKVAVIDKASRVVAADVIYPTPPKSDIEGAKKKILQLIHSFQVDVIAIGNGTASKETETFVANLLHEADRKVMYMVVSEAGASVYSASALAAKEFPQYDVSLRSAVSIARRLSDPLSELVKIDPKSIGVGQYQHDMNKKNLDQSLCGVVEDCVNAVGVNLNTASAPLLSYISGIHKTLAENIVNYREEHGRFHRRKELLNVPKLGSKTFEQCVGFLRIPESDNIFDNTGIHPESYTAADKLLKALSYTQDDIIHNKTSDLESRIAQYGKTALADTIGVGLPTLCDIVAELQKPGRDIRDSLPKPQLRGELMDIADLKEGMILSGTVRNVTDFGAFVDIGVHQDGLVHVSQISDRFIKHPTEAVKVGDIVRVRVLSADCDRGRIALSMKTENTTPEKK